LSEAITFYQKLRQELDELTDQGQSIEQLEQDYETALQKLEQTCQILTQLRQQAAYQLEQQLIQELKPLAMDKVMFECRLIPLSPNATGADQIMFYFSPNPGEPLQPLANTASGGEMSRFLLALKACFSTTEKQSGTLVFDEIDAGVSGKVAQAIAEKLHQLSQKHQVLCVTHQPLVAAMADSHFRVDKQIVEESPLFSVLNNGDSEVPDLRTVVRITALDNHQIRREEIAQLTGGHSAQEALTFAESLLTKAANIKQQK
jgi:DNA repair protein RecN (Recombination protein N)